MDYQELIKEHYFKNWKNEPEIHFWDKGPSHKLPYDFRVLEFKPNGNREMWTYSTCCMSQPEDENKIELHIFSPEKSDELIEILSSVAYYHRTNTKLNLNDSVYFGKPWLESSVCRYGFISLPYIDGPELENMESEKGLIKFYWLIPITESEVEYKRTHGVEELESLFDTEGLDYLNPDRKSLV